MATTIRNEKLFCLNCGGDFALNFPVPVDEMSKKMKAFDTLHKDCKPTWTEPVNENPEQTEQFCANWWAENGEQGMSSKTMFNHLSKSLNLRRLKNDYPCTPSDPDDFKRCYKLLQAVPQWKARLNELKTISPVWEKLVDNWDKLTSMYEQNVKEDWKNYEQIGMYQFMKELGC
jgi:hypothetical protein